MSAQRKAGASTPGKRAARPEGNGTGRKQTKPKKSLGRRLVKWTGLAFLLFFVLGVAAFAYGYASTDIPNPNKDFQTQTTIVYYANGKSELGRFADQNRTSVSLSEVPKHVQDAVIAAEDRTFYSNKGIDPKGIVRAAFSNARGNSTQGASTITQQYVKVYYLSQERTVTRKVKEAFLSLKLQQTQSKSEILQGYLNTIYFGRGAYGIQAAAKAYFDKDVKDLSVAEGAALAAVLNSPGNYDPALGEAAQQKLFARYRYVLNGMAQMQSIPQNDADEAARRLPKFPKQIKQDMYGGQRGHMLTMVKKQLLAQGFSESEIEGGGLRIRTTFTRKAMRAAAQAVAENRPKGLKGLHVAVASVDPQTGALRGMYGGQDYLKSQINWATAGGSPGSAFKPFALAAAIQDGYSLKSTFQGNSPFLFPNGKDKVVNEGPGDGNDYGEKIDMLKATEESVNTAYMDMTFAMKDGPQKILDTAAALGIPKNAPGLEPNAGISLGSATISPIDMASAYGGLANGGVHQSWYVIAKVTGPHGEELYKNPAKKNRALPEDVTRDTSYALQQVVKAGTGQRALGLGRPAAGKTGTATNDNGDVSSSWFVGYTPQMSTAVMYVRGDGNDALNDYLPPPYGYFGAGYPTLTWTATMKTLLEGEPVEQFPPPAWVKATNDDHAPTPSATPKPSPTKTEKPSPTPEPSSAPPSPTPTKTNGNPNPGPPSPTDTNTCGILGCDPSSSPSDTTGPGNGNGGGGPGG